MAQSTENPGEGGTVLEADDAALVVSADGEISFLMPDYGEEDEVPPLVAALGLLAIKLHDEEFVEELLAELTDDEDDEADDEENPEDDEDPDEEGEPRGS